MFRTFFREFTTQSNTACGGRTGHGRGVSPQGRIKVELSGRRERLGHWERAGDGGQVGAGMQGIKRRNRTVTGSEPQHSQGLDSRRYSRTTKTL